jgi:pimeloyl-ACP methyl ester carboxylesterase
MSALEQRLVGSTVRRPDGLAIGFAEFGAPGGTPVILTHGYGDSRLTRHPDDSILSRLDIRLITLDRPGVGLSDYRPARSVLDWADEIATVADHLGLQRFALLGWSGGGPHALAGAYRFPDRLTATGVIAGFAPFDRPNATDGMRDDMRKFLPILRRVPWLARPMTSSLPREYRQDPAKAFEKQFGRGQPDPDRRALADQTTRDNLLAGAVEAVRQGSKGLATDMQLFLARSWGFMPSEIAGTVFLWYGDADTLVPLQMGQYLARTIPKSRLTVYPGEGHMIFYRHWEEILGTLAAAGR